MATILKQEQKNRSIQVRNIESARKDVLENIKKESELCDIFIREFNNLDGWICYPEAAGFDVLAVHQDGRQIGVEAKIALNAKVADQILPWHGNDYYERPGPDHRLVIVSRITDASAGIAKMLERQGVRVIQPRISRTVRGDEFTFQLEHQLVATENRNRVHCAEPFLFDWNPSERCRVPILATNLPAGVPSPIKLTPWKESALIVVALLRKQGFITSKQIAARGISAHAWTQAQTGKNAWLAKGDIRGQWVETEHLPPFDKQHPDVYALAMQAVINELQKIFVLT
ncbi:hypothetical protein [Pseudomonas sp. DSV-1]|uniref:hypothetical protein n=1 Tax=Pseudomonas sp. DSV-1 TaxID=3112250 RepID=UPI002DBF2476|nr:hypothetical protein [Pseudomonas sp. DSV-1]MEC4242144.1 hypothetical protein [Pseudomonas sp. DSV-1]